jgi:microcystin degradation protein MlrC
VLLSVRDPDAAEAAIRAGAGATAELALGTGGRGAGAYNERTHLEVRIERLFDGDVVYAHLVNAGYRAATAPSALLCGPGGCRWACTAAASASSTRCSTRSR